jgi:cytochrome c biogenesis protein CcmG/thiol:disulfide interchange protein DsbE
LFLAIFFSGASAAVRAGDRAELLAIDNAGVLEGKLDKGDVIYIDFWASWCTPCKNSFSWMNKMHEKYKHDGFSIIAVTLDKKPEKVTVFLEEIPAKFQILYDPEGQSAIRYGVKAMPSSFLINRKGVVVSVNKGFRESETSELEKKISHLLKEEL